MGFLKDDFGGGTHFSEIPANWFNQVAGFVNSIRGTGLVYLRKPAFPSDSEPVEIVLDIEAVQSVAGEVVTAALEALPEAVIVSDADPVQDEIVADAGESAGAARADHAHPVPLPFTGNLSSRTVLSLTGTSADAADWANEDNTGVGCEIKVCTRWKVVSTVQTLFYRNMIFDLTGRLVSVSAEYTTTLANA